MRPTIREKRRCNFTRHSERLRILVNQQLSDESVLVQLFCVPAVGVGTSPTGRRTNSRRRPYPGRLGVQPSPVLLNLRNFHYDLPPYNGRFECAFDYIIQRVPRGRTEDPRSERTELGSLRIGSRVAIVNNPASKHPVRTKHAILEGRLKVAQFSFTSQGWFATGRAKRKHENVLVAGNCFPLAAIILFSSGVRPRIVSVLRIISRRRSSGGRILRPRFI